MKKVILFVTGAAGGAQRVTVTIAKMLDKSRFEVKLVISSTKECELSKFVPGDLPVEYMNEQHLRLKAFFKMLQMLRLEKPDYAFASMSLLCIFLIIICKYFVRGVKPIVRGQINPSHWGNKGLVPKLVKRFFPDAYKVVAQTPMMRQEMIEILGVPESKCYQLYNPIDTDYIDSCIVSTSPYDVSDSYKFVAIGRCAHQKGFDLLIRALKQVREVKPNTHVYIVGTKSNDYYGNSLDMLVNELDLADYVHFEGFQSNPYKYLYHSDCFVLSSRDEGLPNVLIESTYLKKQAIAYKCIPIVSEIISDGINGLCVEPEDITGLAKAMIKIQSLDLNSASTYYPSSAKEYNSLFQ